MLKTPPLQTATATIDTLSGRLQSATLLEDRRAAILGLRSFAKQYPASVASGSLRELIATLKRDGLGGDKKESSGGEGTGDVDTIRLVLETLVMLFNYDANSPEAGEEIGLFLADEFAMRQDNISLLLTLLDPTSPYADYYSRLYSLQLLQAICASRPQRLQECILSAPLGISRLVAILDDGRDAVRNAGLLLLVDLTGGAGEDLKKIVAFEDVFARVFNLIKAEGGLAEAGITAQDCLSLLANLIRGSASNQTMFRESGCVLSLAQLLQQAFPPSVEDRRLEATFVTQSREKSAFGLLQLLRLILVSGEPSTGQNQTAFFRAGTAQILLDIGFASSLPIPIRTAALRCASDLIANNAPIQENFAALTVITAPDSDTASTSSQQQQVNGTSRPHSNRQSAEQERTYIIEALLSITLDRPHDDMSLRHAASSLIQAYLTNHERIKAHFLQRAISGHAQQEEAANVLTTLAQSNGDNSDPTALMFASWVVQELVDDNPEAKAALASVKEGDESVGEDVLSLIQSLGSELEAALSPSQSSGTSDIKVVAAYSGLLTVFLWDFAEGVDDLLAEGSSLLQTLAMVPKVRDPDPLVAGLAVSLLGAVYEFSTKDSPIARRTLTPLLTQKLGRSKYLESLSDLRREPAIRDLDLEDEEHIETLLSRTFVDLFTVEYSRLRKAIDKDPGIEVLPASAMEAGVDRDILDDLRQQLQTSKDALAQAQEESMSSEQKHEQERLSAAKDLQTSTAEIERLRRINQSMQQGHESELEDVTSQHEEEKRDLVAKHAQALDDTHLETQRQIENAVREKEASYVELGNTLRSEQGGHASTRQQLESLKAKHNVLATSEQGVSDQMAALTQQHNKLQREHEELQGSATQATSRLERVQSEAEAQSSELEGLRVQVRDLRDELRAREEELAAERAGFAELEKELVAVKSDSTTTTPNKGDDDAEKLKAQLEAAQESEKSAKEELESMLLVMGDIEAKRDQYREKVKGLGGEISDDADDDDEEGGEDIEGDEVD